MIEFGRAPALCSYCGPSHVLVREDVASETLLACLKCAVPIGTAAEVCGFDLFSFPDQLERLIPADAGPPSHPPRT